MQPAQEIPKSSIFYMDQAKTRSALLCKTNISGEAAKKCDKCRQMQYIGKSYVTTVYKCDDGKKLSPSLSETTVTSVDNVF